MINNLAVYLLSGSCPELTWPECDIQVRKNLA